jgi:hypothetical protein
MKGKTNVRLNRRPDSSQPKERSPRLAADLEETLQRVTAYRGSDPHFERGIATFAEAKASPVAEDPVEGQTARAEGPAQQLVRRPVCGSGEALEQR